MKQQLYDSNPKGQCRIDVQSLFPSAFVICYEQCIPAQLMQFPWMSWQYLSYIPPQGSWPLLHWGWGGKVPLRIQWPCSSLTMYFLMACWGHMCWLTLFRRNKNWQNSLEGSYDSALTEQHQTAELCLLFQQFTRCCDFFPEAGGKRDARQRGQNGTGRRGYLSSWKAILNNSSGIRKVTL